MCLDPVDSCWVFPVLLTAVNFSLLCWQLSVSSCPVDSCQFCLSHWPLSFSPCSVLLTAVHFTMSWWQLLVCLPCWQLSFLCALLTAASFILSWWQLLAFSCPVNTCRFLPVAFSFFFCPVDSCHVFHCPFDSCHGFHCFVDSCRWQWYKRQTYLAWTWVAPQTPTSRSTWPRTRRRSMRPRCIAKRSTPSSTRPSPSRSVQFLWLRNWLPPDRNCIKQEKKNNTGNEAVWVELLSWPNFHPNTSPQWLSSILFSVHQASSFLWLVNKILHNGVGTDDELVVGGSNNTCGLWCHWQQLLCGKHNIMSVWVCQLFKETGIWIWLCMEISCVILLMFSALCSGISNYFIAQNVDLFLCIM